MRHLDLFSGLGGFSLAARWMNWTTIGFVEIEDYPRRVLARNFPGVPLHDDIRTFDARGLHPDIVTGGPPCQSHSVAGSRRGRDDPRHLWPEFARVVAQTRPAWVVVENVAGLRTTASDEILADLESLDYTGWPLLVGALHAGAPYRRQRVWIVANANGGDLRDAQQRRSAGRPGGVRDEGSAEPGHDGAQGAAAHANARRCEGLGLAEHAVEQGQPGHQPDRLGEAGRRDGAHWRCGCGHRFARELGRYGCPNCCGEFPAASADARRLLLETGRARDGDGRGPAARDGTVYRPDWAGWTDAPEPVVRPVANGLPAWVVRCRVPALRALGNAVVPQVALELFRAIADIDGRRG